VLFQLTGWLRAVWRLTLVVGVTGVCVIRLTVACLVKGRDFSHGGIAGESGGAGGCVLSGPVHGLGGG
jgi:hypothetical protein